jgi:hypothetical protein
MFIKYACATKRGVNVRTSEARIVAHIGNMVQFNDISYDHSIMYENKKEKAMARVKSPKGGWKDDFTADMPLFTRVMAVTNRRLVDLGDPSIKGWKGEKVLGFVPAMEDTFRSKQSKKQQDFDPMAEVREILGDDDEYLNLLEDEGMTEVGISQPADPQLIEYCQDVVNPMGYDILWAREQSWSDARMERVADDAANGVNNAGWAYKPFTWFNYRARVFGMLKDRTKIYDTLLGGNPIDVARVPMKFDKILLGYFKDMAGLADKDWKVRQAQVRSMMTKKSIATKKSVVATAPQTEWQMPRLSDAVREEMEMEYQFVRYY